VDEFTAIDDLERIVKAHRPPEDTGRAKRSGAILGTPSGGYTPMPRTHSPGLLAAPSGSPGRGPHSAEPLTTRSLRLACLSHRRLGRRLTHVDGTAEDTPPIVMARMCMTDEQ
jgi:hypothetical protein